MMATIQSWMPIASMVVALVVALLHKFHKDSVADKIAAVDAKVEQYIKPAAPPAP